MEQSHRSIDDQQRHSAIFSRFEAWVMESAASCRERGGVLVEAADVEAALRAQEHRHDYLAQRVNESVERGEHLISVSGARIGQINALAQIDLGDYRFGFPVRVSARTFAGEDGVLSIEREVELSGPIHSKGVLILKSFLAATFAHVGPLAMDASIVFEQEYQLVDGDSASCAELFALLSSMAKLPLKQCIAVTGAINQHGDVLPVGGIDEKIEAFFRLCTDSGLDGTQGVLIPLRNRQHLMLDKSVIEAVAAGKFHIHAVEYFDQALELLMGVRAGEALARGGYSKGSVLGRVQESLVAYRRACKHVVQLNKGYPRSL